MSPLDRREFLGAALAVGGVLAFPRALRAAPAGGPRRTVVLLHLVGGNDGLNTVVPFGSRRYRALRPTLALAGDQVVRLTGELGLHPSLRPLEDLWKRKRLAILNGVGYPDPDYSHFRATEIWQTAEPTRAPTFGWVGRAIDVAAAQRGAAPLRAVALGREQPLALNAATPSVATLTDFDRFRLPPALERAAALYAPAEARTGAAAAVAEAGERALRIAERIARLAPDGGPMAGSLGEDLRRALALLKADLALDALHVSFGGFDTHASQARTHGELLAVVAQNLVQWQDRLERAGLGERVVTVVYSEFGRRAEENASAGTDHGSAAPVFVLGQGVAGGFHGAVPSLDDLDDGNLRFTTDFRRLYAALVRHAWDLDPQSIVGDFAPVEVFA
jgi:uncharacterized protein (DUF1501 family)